MRSLPVFGLIWLAACAAPLPPPRAPTPAELAQLAARAHRDRSADAQVAYGAALRAGGQRDSARAVLGRVVAAEPRDAPALLYLGLTEEDSGDYARAEELYRRYLAAGKSAPLKAQVRRRVELLQRKELAVAMRNAVAQEYQLSAGAPEPRTVGVFPFDYAGGDPELAPLQRALSSLLTTDLSQTQRLRVLERTRVQALVDEIKLSSTALVDPATAVRSGRLLRADRIVQGRIGGTSAALRIAAAVVGVGGANNGRISPVQVQDPVAKLFDMEKQLALDLYQSMGIQLTPTERERVERRATENLQALLQFGWGLQMEDGGRYADAARYFRKAATLDPNFAEAAERARADEALAAAADESTDALAAVGIRLESDYYTPVPMLMQPWRLGAIPTIDIEKVRVLLPDPIARDPGSEILGIDGLVARAGLIVTVRRP